MIKFYELRSGNEGITVNLWKCVREIMYLGKEKKKKLGMVDAEEPWERRKLGVEDEEEGRQLWKEVKIEVWRYIYGFIDICTVEA